MWLFHSSHTLFFGHRFPLPPHFRKGDVESAVHMRSEHWGGQRREVRVCVRSRGIQATLLRRLSSTRAGQLPPAPHRPTQVPLGSAVTLTRSHACSPKRLPLGVDAVVPGVKAGRARGITRGVSLSAPGEHAQKPGLTPLYPAKPSLALELNAGYLVPSVFPPRPPPGHLAHMGMPSHRKSSGPVLHLIPGELSVHVC